MRSAQFSALAEDRDVMPGPSISAGRRQGAQDLRRITAVTDKGNGLGRGHVQRKYPDIDFH